MLSFSAPPKSSSKLTAEFTAKPPPKTKALIAYFGAFLGHVTLGNASMEL
jgi:hypothetical protein